MRSVYDQTTLADAQLEISLGFSDSQIKTIQNDSTVKTISKSFQITTLKTRD